VYIKAVQVVTYTFKIYAFLHEYLSSTLKIHIRLTAYKFLRILLLTRGVWSTYGSPKIPNSVSTYLGLFYVPYLFIYGEHIFFSNQKFTSVVLEYPGLEHQAPWWPIEYLEIAHSSLKVIWHHHLFGVKRSLCLGKSNSVNFVRS
jgi:hypothetical protein